MHSVTSFVVEIQIRNHRKYQEGTAKHRVVIFGSMKIETIVVELLYLSYLPLPLKKSPIMSISLPLADQIIRFNRELSYTGTLPPGFGVLNPFLENPETMEVMERFYRKYYADFKPRRFIIGINPGRHGAGTTGVPFTDTKRLEQVCGISMKSEQTHEVSSVFVYDMIAAFGGAEAFYNQFYINSPFPLAIVRQQKDGRWLNANYYDDLNLFDYVKVFMAESMKRHFELGLDCKEVFVLGKKNARYLDELNKQHRFFDKMTVLDHPRYIQQYQSREKQFYIDKYLSAFAKGH